MEDRVFVVTSGEYEDYHIEAIFKDKSKAENYLKCHKDSAVICEDFQIEEWKFDDDTIYTPCNIAKIRFEIRHDDINPVNISFICIAKEEYKDFMFKGVLIKTNDDNNDWKSIDIYFDKFIPDDYDEEKLKDEYKQICHNLKSEILDIISKSNCDYSNYKDVGKLESVIMEYIKSKV